MDNLLTDPTVTWYGPHPCEDCGATVVRAALERGGARFNPPARLLRVYQRGSESSDVEIVYPKTWTPHVCDETAKANYRGRAEADQPPHVS